MYNVIIIGAGPAGLSAGLRAKELGLDYLIIERKQPANTIANYPENKPILDYPKEIKLFGNIPFSETNKEQLTKSFNDIAKQLNIVIEEVSDISNISGNYIIKTNKKEYETKFVILAIGIQGKPKCLGIKGEEKAKNKFEPVENCDVCVVGGGDTAVESAVELSKKCNVTLSYRKPKFFRIKKENEEKLKNSTVNVIFDSELKQIDEGHIHLNTKDGEKEVNAKHVFIFTGTSPQSDFFKKIGLNLENDKPTYNEKYEAKQNLFVAGDLTKEPLIKNAINHGYKIIEEIKKRID